MRVLLADDHPLFLEGLCNMLSTRGVQVVGSARDGLQAQEMARRLRPDVILMDIHMPRCDGLEATRRIKIEMPEIKIVMLTIAAEDETLFTALKNGASGYLLKNLESGKFFDLLTDLQRGEIVLAPGLAARLLTEFTRPTAEDETPTESEPSAPLTQRQLEILRRVAQGVTYKEIAAALHFSERTVKYHMGRILEQLQLESRVEAIAYAHQQGLVDPED
ncbi:MAG: response regulator transcription factor [Chloroflexi bacterium]|nr:response regulator transcription factor [Chloroflexota bacterium]